MSCLDYFNEQVAWCTLFYLISHIRIFNYFSIKHARSNRNFKILTSRNNSIPVTSCTLSSYDFSLACTSWTCLSHHIIVSASNMYSFCCPTLPLTVWTSDDVILILGSRAKAMRTYSFLEDGSCYFFPRVKIFKSEGEFYLNIWAFHLSQVFLLLDIWIIHFLSS